MSRADQEWLARQTRGRAPATRGGAVYDSTDPTLVPEKEAAWASQLADYVGAEFARLSSWRTRANVMVMADEADPLRSSKNPTGAIYVSRPAVYVNGSAIPTAYEIRNDTTVNPSVPADVPLSTDTLTPEAKLVKWQISREQVDQVRSIAASNGADLTVPPGASAIDPFVARTLAAGAVKAAETWLMAGGIDGFPVGLLHEPSTNAQTATGNGLFELAKAIADTKARFRDPNLVLISPEGERYFRAMIDSAGRPIFNPQLPLSIGDVPIVTTYGLPVTQPQTFVVLDAKLWNVLLRRLANGKWLQVDRTMHTAFNADSLIYRLTFRIDADLTPVSGPESTTLISIRTA